jgi:hypothetical protein
VIFLFLGLCLLPPCSLGLSATSRQYFYLRTNQPPATRQQYPSLRTNQHQPSATSQPNWLFVCKFSFGVVVLFIKTLYPTSRLLNEKRVMHVLNKNGHIFTIHPSYTVSMHAAGGWLQMIVYCVRKVLLAGCWWLV